MIADGVEEITKAVRLCCREVRQHQDQHFGDDLSPAAHAASTVMSEAEVMDGGVSRGDFGRR